MISTRRQRLSFDSGRVSMMRTVSPAFAEFSSSCALSRVVRVTIFLYIGCGTRRSIATTTVFCISSLTTMPTRVLRALRGVVACSFRVTSAMVFQAPPRSARLLGGGLHPRPGARLLGRRTPRGRRLHVRHRTHRALPLHSLHPRDISAHRTKAERIVKRLTGRTKSQVELLSLQLRNSRHQIGVGQILHLFSLHRSAPPRVQQTCSSLPTWQQPAPLQPAQCHEALPPARTAHGQASPLLPTSRVNPFPCPSAPQPASSLPACPGISGSKPCRHA